MFKNFDSFCIHQGALRKETTVDGEVLAQLVLPLAFVNLASDCLSTPIFPWKMPQSAAQCNDSVPQEENC